MQGGKIGRSFHWWCRMLTFGLFWAVKKGSEMFQNRTLQDLLLITFTYTAFATSVGSCSLSTRKLFYELQQVMVLPSSKLSSVTCYKSSVGNQIAPNRYSYNRSSSRLGMRAFNSFVMLLYSSIKASSDTVYDMHFTFLHVYRRTENYLQLFSTSFSLAAILSSRCQP